MALLPRFDHTAALFLLVGFHVSFYRYGTASLLCYTNNHTRYDFIALTWF
jgi:hypothetical protein